jgi:hypothetical protein
MTFIPNRLAITAITKANPAVVTTATSHNLTTGQIVRINVPQNYGMVELNHLLASITRLSGTTFSLQYSQIPTAINVNSTSYTTFVIPSNPSFTAEVLAVGSGPTPITRTAWQALNNFCDDTIEDATQNIATVNQPF